MTELIRYDAACKALAAAKAVDEVKGIRNKAEALRAYAAVAKNRDLEIDAAEIRIRAERRLGELIQQQKETVGLNPGTRIKGGSIRKHSGSRVERPPELPTLADAGISKDLSSRSQKLAALPDKKFESLLGDWREKATAKPDRVTIDLMRNGKRPEEKKQTPKEEPFDGASAWGKIHEDLMRHTKQWKWEQRQDLARFLHEFAEFVVKFKKESMK